MKRYLQYPALCLLLIIPAWLSGQTGFSQTEYADYLRDHRDMSAEQLLSEHAPDRPYYSGRASPTDFSEYAYYDSLMHYLQLTENERDILGQYHFMVSERLSYGSFGRALHEVYMHDLPVMVTSDAVLHALHMSYDRILMDLELHLLGPNLHTLLTRMYNNLPALADRYPEDDSLHHALQDVDLYVTVALRLLEENPIFPHFATEEKVSQIMDAIESESFQTLPLFTYEGRKLDFSQFTVRGHYTEDFSFGDNDIPLSAYFRSMMWLGRIDFLLTAPSPADRPELSEASILRMNMAALMLNSLLDISGARSLLNTNDRVITRMVGKSDNLTAPELSQVVDSLGISSAVDLKNDTIFQDLQTALHNSVNAGQQILSSIIIADPLSTEPDPLPVSFKLLGQRFILDSYILANLVYDRIIYDGKKVWRPMPDPLDAMFVLGNDDPLPLLEPDLEQYHYAGELSALRYLTDHYDQEFWQQSLYNAWLQSIRKTMELPSSQHLPFFMRTTAWQQEKLNTQLASWSQLRHDNLLYAKQSYTSATTCSFPHSYVEPYPGLYYALADFARQAETMLSEYAEPETPLQDISAFFTRMAGINDTLTVLAEKELNGKSFSGEEQNFLRRMLFREMGSGEPPYSGWYAQLFYDNYDAAKEDYVVADIHTQPTDQTGNPVGRVLHAGVGKVNLGVFLGPAPSQHYEPMAFAGPVMSFYSAITRNFDRLTDERWTTFVENDQMPERPEWVYPYLADKNGERYPAGVELPGQQYVSAIHDDPGFPSNIRLNPNYPNPFNSGTVIRYTLPQSQHVSVQVYDLAGRHITTLMSGVRNAGEHRVTWDGRDLEGHPVSSGVYIYRLHTGKKTLTEKMVLIR